MLWLVSQGKTEGLKQFVAKPEKFRQNWKQTALLFTDQVPVWLMVEGDTQAFSRATQKRQRKQQAARREVRQKVKSGQPVGDDERAEAAASENYQTRGPGSTNASRFRITYMARQAVKDYFDTSCRPAGEAAN